MITNERLIKYMGSKNVTIWTFNDPWKYFISVWTRDFRMSRAYVQNITQRHLCSNALLKLLCGQCKYINYKQNNFLGRTQM